MNLSFYSSAVGASAQQKRLDVIANNLANVNTAGYKTKSINFAELVYANIRQIEGESKLRQGVGVRSDKIDTLFSAAGLQMTDGQLDFAITSDGFFAVQNPGNGEIYYTRDGSFKLSQNSDGQFYLATAEGYFVLDAAQQRIAVTPETNELPIGVFDFENKQGFMNVGMNMYMPVEKNGAPILLEDIVPQRGYLELSGVDSATEMTRMIETQRVFQLNLRMVTTSDEIEQTVNSLRG